MADVQFAIAQMLGNDTDVGGISCPQPLGLGFQILDRWPQRSGPGSTPQAYDSLQGGRLKRCVIVLDGGEVEHPGRQPGWTKQNLDSFPTLHIVAEAHANGKAAVKAADARIAAILTPARVDQGGEHISFRRDSMTVREDFEGFPGNVRAIRRWRATWSTRLV